MADFTAPSWLFPKDGPFDNFIKGSQVGAAIAANRIRAKAVYAEIQQGQQRMDLAEREQITRNVAASLRNKVIQTKLANDAADFEVLREWWPQFQQSEGEVDMPVLRDENTMLKVAAAVAEKRSKIGQAAFAELMATPGFDLANAEHQKQYFELLSRYKNIPAKLGPDGVMGPIKVAESLKRLRDEAARKISADKGVAEAVTIGFDEQGNPITENFVRFGNRIFRSTQHEIVEDPKSKKRFIKSGTGALHVLEDGEEGAVSTNPDTGAKYIEAIPILDKAGKQVGLGYRGAKGNIIRIPQETGPKLSQAEKTKYDNELKALNDDEEAKLKALAPDSVEANALRKTFNLKRRALHKKTFGEEPVILDTAPSPSGANRVSVIAPDGKPGTIPESQLEEALKSGYKRP